LLGLSAASPELVLFVDDRQPELIEQHSFFDQGGPVTIEAPEEISASTDPYLSSEASGQTLERPSGPAR
jgi:hypothetical protein